MALPKAKKRKRSSAAPAPEGNEGAARRSALGPGNSPADVGEAVSVLPVDGLAIAHRLNKGKVDVFNVEARGGCLFFAIAKVRAFAMLMLP